MSRRLPEEYSSLMRDALKSDSTNDRPLKRKRKYKASQEDLVNKTNNSSLESSLNSLNPTTRSRDLVAKSIGTSAIETIIIESDDELIPQTFVDTNTVEVVEVDGDVGNDEHENEDSDDDDEDDDDEFEDVNLDNIKPRASSSLTSDVVITSYDSTKLQPKKVKKKLNIIGREESLFRKNFHRTHLAIMLVHGFARNSWCNNKLLQNHLLKLIKPSIYNELHPSKDVEMPQIRTRKLLDGLRHLMIEWNKYYKVTSNKGIYRHDWYDWYELERTKTDFTRFSRCITKGRGSRDIGAQGFVLLLRAAGVPSRLVYSIQSPDFTSKQIKEKKRSNEIKEKVTKPSIRDKVAQLRRGDTKVTSTAPTKAEIEMEYPVFWAEAWDSASKVWITIDPIMLKIVENITYKSKIEPPMSYKYNRLLYVIGYDRKCGVRDITKRYSEKYYSKTRKKRITKDETEEIFFETIVSALSKRGRNKSDDYEDEYFRKKATREGMPDTIQDFKNHPFYVLEMHLKSNEVLQPKESCGTIRLKNKNKAIPVYRRENVQVLKSPRGWFQVGRVLKPGMKFLKTKLKNPNQIKSEDDDKEERLYAEFQTDLYIPPPIIDGIITKNAYGNLDVYVPSMIPAGGVIIDAEYSEEAAKLIDIDYAPAVVAFKFDKKQVTPKFGGIVVAEEYKEAIESVALQLKAEAVEKERLELELRALKGWDLLLTKLRIKNRLNKTHGKIDEKGGDSDDESGRLEEEYFNYLENQGDASDVTDNEADRQQYFETGGFVAKDADFDSYYDNNEVGGGLIAEEAEEGEERGDTGGGFLIESEPEDNRISGGFLIEDGDGVTGTPTQEFQNEPHEEQPMDDPKENGVEIDDITNQSDHLDEFEAFFDGLDQYDDNGYDSDKSSFEKPSLDTVNALQKSLTSEKSELFTDEETLNKQRDQFKSLAPDEIENDTAKSGSDIEELNDEIKYEENPKAIERIVLNEEIKQPANFGKETSFDFELEKEFAKQLEDEELRAKISTGDNETQSNEDDFEFDYESE